MKLPMGFLLVVLASALAAAEPPAVILNEIHYHPPGPAGLREEFVELHNRSDAAIDLHGWRFTRGIRFRFDRASAEVNIPAGGFLLLARDPAALARISGIPATAIAGPYDGKLSNFGERLELVDARGEVVEEVEYSRDGDWPARADGLGSSLQRISGESSGKLARNWAVAAGESQITPGRRNAVSATVVPPLVCLLERVPREPRSSDPVTVRVRIDGELERAELHYDAGADERVLPLLDDGRGPDRQAGDGIHAARIPPAADGTIVRFRITAHGASGSVFRLPRGGNPSSQLGYYVLDEPRKGNEDLEVFHILWNGRLRCTRGAWLPGCTLVHRGTAYLNVRLKYRGLTSCGMPKSGLKVQFNRGDLFRGRRQLNFLAGWQDRSLLREKLAWDLFRKIGHPHARAGMAAVYTNGNRFHGLFVMLDEPGSDYLRRNGIDTKNTLWKCTSSFLGLKNPRYRDFRKLNNSEDGGDASAILELERELTSLKGRERIDYVLKHIDVESLIEYQAIKCLLSDEDAYTKNWMLCQETRRDAASGENFHRWTVHPWDLDLSFGQYSLNQDGIRTDRHPLAGTADHPRAGSHGLRWSGFLEAVFGRESGDFFVRALYGRIWGLLEDKFHPDVIGEEIDRLDDHTIVAARADLQKWPRWGLAPQDPEFHRQRLRAYVAARHAFLREFLSAENPTTASEVVPWLPFLAPRAAEGVAPPRARTYRTFRYTPAPRLKITEIHYNPGVAGDALEFVEFHNLETRDVDLTGWTVPALAYSFPPGSTAPAGAAIVLARDPEALAARHEALSRDRVFGPYSGRLSNRGEDLRLRDSGLYRGKRTYPETIDVVKYRDRSPWPAAADGEGSSLELQSLSLDNDLPESWRASARAGGSPGRL